MLKHGNECDRKRSERGTGAKKEREKTREKPKIVLFDRAVAFWERKKKEFVPRKEMLEESNYNGLYDNIPHSCICHQYILGEGGRERKKIEGRVISSSQGVFPRRITK